MLRLRKCFLAHILSPASAPSVSIHRLLSAAAPSTSTNRTFAVEDYLVAACGLTPAQALKASAKLAHLKSPAKPDAVLAFLRGHGLSGADLAALVAKDPQFLCASVEKILAPNVADLTSLGLPRHEISRLVLQAHIPFRGRSMASKVQYYLPLFGSWESLFRALKHRPYILSSDLERKVKPNVAFLRECGLGACDIVSLCTTAPRLLHTGLERVWAMAACAEGLGVSRGSKLFCRALEAIAFVGGEDKFTTKMEWLKQTLRWSDAEVAIAVSKEPLVLKYSKDMLRRKSEFLLSVVGLEPAYIAHRPVMLCLSLEGRLRPRFYVLKFLEENGLLKCHSSYCTVVKQSEKVFMEKFVHPYEVAAPCIAQDYAAACRGEVPSRFRYTRTYRDAMEMFSCVSIAQRSLHPGY